MIALRNLFIFALIISAIVALRAMNIFNDSLTTIAALALFTISFLGAILTQSFIKNSK